MSSFKFNFYADFKIYKELAAENSELLTIIGLLFLKLGNNTKAFEYLVRFFLLLYFFAFFFP